MHLVNQRCRYFETLFSLVEINQDFNQEFEILKKQTKISVQKYFSKISVL